MSSVDGVNDLMKRSPRNPRNLREPLFSRKMLFLSLMQGFIVLGVVPGVFWLAISRGEGEQELRALTFTTLMISNLGLILINRSWSRTFFLPCP